MIGDKNEIKSRIASEVLIILGILALLTLITRLWPILLLVMLGIIVCALRLLFIRLRTVEVIVPAEPVAPPPPETELSILQKAFGLLQQRISEELEAQFPSARWVWESQSAIQRFKNNEPLFVLLNRAGGYCKAQVIVHNLMFKGLRFQTLDTGAAPTAKNAACDDAPNDVDDSICEALESENAAHDDDVTVNYSRLAFEWVDANATAINEMCNEAIAGKETETLIHADILPHPDSWQDICEELKRNGFSATALCEDGIKIILTL
jgi:hypothetical protein